MSEGVGIVGAGLAGSLLACSLARRGDRVTLYDRRPDPRSGAVDAGRSINLALSHRGLRALDAVGLSERVLAGAVPMRGRMMHDPAGDLSFQPYGTRADQVIHSVSRDGLNRLLLEEADRSERVALRFERRCVDVDLEAVRLEFEDPSGARAFAEHAWIVGADGAYSAVRARMQRSDGFDYAQSYLSHGYKELTMPPAPGGGWRMEPNALHIWPRGGFMMIALPNADGSYTCTLFWPLEGRNSFAEVSPGPRLAQFFEEHFPDALPLLPDLQAEYATNPVGSLVTIRCGPWNVGERAVLIGDAAHAVVPFYGQGMNASFEDCRLLVEALEADPDRGRALAAYARSRKPDTDALADLAVYNYRVMRDLVASRRFLLGRAVGRLLHRVFPRAYLPLYTMVTFTSMPYAEAVRRDVLQRRVVLRIGLLAALLVLSGAIIVLLVRL